MKPIDYMLKYLGEGDLSALDKIVLAFEKEVYKAVEEELRQVLNVESTSRDKEIEEILRQEKEEYEVKKKQFYENPIHWSNNKRRIRGLPVLRGRVNKCRSKKFPSFKPTSRAFFLIEDTIEETLPESWKNDKFFNKIVDIKNIDVGDKNLFFIE